MAGPAPEALTDIPPAAREAVSALTGAPTQPVRILISGGIGTGKSSVLATMRTALRAAGVAVATRSPRADDDQDAAIVIDDAHLLADEELDKLAERVSDPGSTVVIATEPLIQRPPLRALATALERQNPVISLGSLTAQEVSEAAAKAIGGPAPTEVVRALMVSTAGLPFLLRPAIAAAVSPNGEHVATAIVQAAKFALIERLRRVEEPVLDALLVSSLSQDLGADDVAAALRIDTDEAQRTVDRARASGLIEPSHSQAFLHSVHDGIAQITGAARHHDIEIALLCSQIELSTLSSDLALRMAEHGLHDDRLADALVDLASRNRGQPAKAARLYRAAAEAGATAVSVRVADALALTGDCTTAGRLTDELLASADPAERAAAVRIAASIAVHDGSVAQAADLFRWLGPYPDAFVSAANAIVSVAAGDSQAARTALSVQSAGPPTSTARAAHSLAEGLLLSLEQPFPVAVARLGQSITSEQHQPGVAPDSPAALVTLAALHGGDPVRARSVIGRAVRAGSEDDTFSAHRHRLLLGWVRMQDGQLSSALADAAAVGDASLHRRDALWAAALNTAIARRSGDGGAVQKHWYAAVEVLAEYSVDLFSLLPLGELWVAAARMRQVDRLQHTLDEAFSLLASLGRPGVVVCAAALGRRPCRNIGELTGGGRSARPCPHCRRRPQRVRQGARGCRPNVAAGTGQSRRRRRGDRRGSVAVAIRTHLRRHPAGRAGRVADSRREGVGRNVATCPRSQAHDRGRRRASRRVSGRRRSDGRLLAASRRRGCPTANARSPNCCCSACRTAISAVNCSSRPRPSNIMWPGSAAGSERNPARKCSRCCGRCWPRRADPPPNPLTSLDPLIEFPHGACISTGVSTDPQPHPGQLRFEPIRS